MKKILALTIVLLLTTVAFSQTYRQREFYNDESTKTYFSHWKPINNPAQKDTFVIWGHRRLYNDSTAMMQEVVFYKGTTQQMSQFLEGIVNLASNNDEGGYLVSYIQGYKVRASKTIGIREAALYNRQRQLIADYPLYSWKSILKSFEKYCAKWDVRGE